MREPPDDPGPQKTINCVRFFAQGRYLSCETEAIAIEYLDASPTFQVFFGPATDLILTNSLGPTKGLGLPYADLSSGTSYRWQVASLSRGVTNLGPVQEFVVGEAGPLAHFLWSGVSPIEYRGAPCTVTVKAKDHSENTITDFSGNVAVAALAPGLRRASILITEVARQGGATRFGGVEFMNVSKSAVDVSGWEIDGYDSVSWPLPRFTTVIPTNSIVQPGTIFLLQGGGSAPGAIPSLYFGTDIAWGAFSNNLAAVSIRDQTGAFVDFMCVGAAYPGQITVPASVPVSEWYGSPVPATPLSSVITYQRCGDTDHQNRSDWTAAWSSFGSQNASCSSVFLPGPGSLGTSPQTLSNFVTGVWEGNLVIQEAGDEVVLLADDRYGHFGTSGLLWVQLLPSFDLAIPEWVNEGTGVVRQAGSIKLPFPLSTNLSVTVVSSQPDLVSVPKLVEVPAGETTSAFDLFVGDDSLLDGTRLVVLSASVDGFNQSIQALPVHDDETAVLGLQLPPQVREGGGPVQGTVSVNRPVDLDCTVVLTSNNPLRLRVPTQVVIPAGKTKTTFDLEMVENSFFIETKAQVTVRAEVANWTPAESQVEILDNKNSALTLVLPSSVDALQGTLKGGGQLLIAGRLRSSLPVTLTAAPNDQLSLPQTVVIPPGRTNVSFDLGVSTNGSFRGLHTVTVAVSAPGFSSASRLVEVTDERLSLLPIPAVHLVYDPKSRHLFASVPGSAPASNSTIAVIDPLSASVQTNVTVSDSPGGMAITEDGQYLYLSVSNRTAIQRVDLKSFNLDPPFPVLGNLGQFATVAGHPEQLVVCVQSSSLTGLFLYENGQALSNAAPGILSFVSGNTATTWIGFAQNPYTGDTIHQIVADANGLTVAKSLGWTTGPGYQTPWVAINGFICNPVGRVVDANTMEELPGVPGAQGQFVAADPVRQRLYYLGDPAEGGRHGTLLLREADLPTRFLGNSVRFNYTQGFGALIRWGDDGLAFAMDGQVYLLRTSLVQSDAPVDVQLAPVLLDKFPLTVGRDFTISLTVSNAGPETATSVQLAGPLPADLKFVRGDASQGTVTSGYLSWFAELGHLTNGGSVQVSLTLQPQKAGHFVFAATLRSHQQDPIPDNNCVRLELPVVFEDQPDSVYQLLLTTSDLVFDPTSQRLFATVPARAPIF